MAVIKTLDDIVNREDQYDVNNMTYYQMSGDGAFVIMGGTLYDTYYRYIIPYVAEYNVTSAQQKYYRSKPHLLSADIYGTPDLAWLIMKLNNRESPSRFYLKQTVRLIPKEHIQTLFSTLYSKAGDRITKNHNKYLKKIGKDVEVSY